MVNTIKCVVRAARASQPFNYLATSLIKATQQATGRELSFLSDHLPKCGVTTSRLPNGRVLQLHAASDNDFASWIFWRGWDGHETETIQLFFRLAERSRTTFDVGAHLGLYTLVAGHAN